MSRKTASSLEQSWSTEKSVSVKVGMHLTSGMTTILCQPEESSTRGSGDHQYRPPVVLDAIGCGYAVVAEALVDDFLAARVCVLPHVHSLSMTVSRDDAFAAGLRARRACGGAAPWLSRALRPHSPRQGAHVPEPAGALVGVAEATVARGGHGRLSEFGRQFRSNFGLLRMSISAACSVGGVWAVACRARGARTAFGI